ncbi:MAG: hypothetical protein EOO73_22190 [Myxococcales bacterium]|nr:MAG: hypothetical protein EOO73_22190 [Myxococcales bacterium]
MTSLSPPLQAVVALFRGPLSEVRFADIDAVGLTGMATEVEAAAMEVEQQEAKLVELRQSLAQRQESLLALAQQALAYARIYAENDEALSAELNDIVLPRAAKPRKPSAKPARADESPKDAAKEASVAPSETATQTEGGESQSEPASRVVDADDSAEALPAEAPSTPGRRKVQRKLARPAAREAV